MFIVKKFRRMIAAAVTAGALIFSPQVDSLNFMSVVRAESSQTNLAEQKFEEANKFYEQGKFAEAIELYTQAIELNPSFAVVYYNLGNVYVELGRIGSTLADFNLLDAAYGKSSDNYKQAIANYTKAIELNFEYAMIAYPNRGACYKKLGDSRKSKADFAKAKELGYED